MSEENRDGENSRVKLNVFGLARQKGVGQSERRCWVQLNVDSTSFVKYVSFQRCCLFKQVDILFLLRIILHMCFNFNNTFEKLEFFCNARGGGMDGSADRRKREGESVGVRDLEATNVLRHR